MYAQSQSEQIPNASNVTQPDMRLLLVVGLLRERPFQGYLLLDTRLKLYNSLEAWFSSYS